MKSRQEIKALAKEAIAQQRGTAILTPLIVVLIAIGGSLLGLIPFIGGLFSLPVSALTLVLSVGLCGVFIKIFEKEKTDVGAPFASLSVNFWRKLGGVLWMSLWLFLWYLPAFVPTCVIMVYFMVNVFSGIVSYGTLFDGGFMLSDTSWAGLISPGLWGVLSALTLLGSIILCVKYFSYALTGYILADCPNVTATKALKLSMRMTKGHRMKLFVLELSFIGWALLSGLTFGILWIVYVGPYWQAAWAGYYLELREAAIASGALTAEELQGEAC